MHRLATYPLATPTGAAKMTPREKVIEAMARAVVMDGRTRMDGSEVYHSVDALKEQDPSLWSSGQECATDALDALLAALPALNLKVVPVDGVPDMNIAGALAWSAELPNSETHVDCAHACFVAMLAAAPDLLGGGE